MPWVKIDDNFYDHPKVVMAGAEGVALFVCALSYSSRYLTDGFIPMMQVPRLLTANDPLAVADHLVQVGLWERADGGYQIHDYLDYNPSAAKVKGEREAAARRQAEWRERHTSNGDTEGPQTDNNGVSNGVTNTHPVPVPVPVPVPNQDSPATPGADAPPEHPPADPEPPQQPEEPPAPKPRRRRTSKPKTPPPPGVQVFRGNAARYPPKAWYSDIDAAVGQQEADLKLWGQIVKAWVGLGWNPTNVKGMLECYGRREIPGGNGPRAGPGNQSTLDKNLDTIEQWVKGAT